jgi:hypothetical protein
LNKFRFEKEKIIMSENTYEGWSLSQLYEEQRKSWNSGMSPDYDGRRALELENALRKRNASPEIRIPKNQSVALNMGADDELTFERLVHYKKDRRYCGTVSDRDPAYCAAIAKACEELGRAKEKESQASEKAGGTVLLSGSR